MRRRKILPATAVALALFVTIAWAAQRISGFDVPYENHRQNGMFT